MEYSLLDLSTLSPEAQKALGSAPGKMMAARGMAPLANPVDLVSVLYQLCLDPDAKIQGPAKSSAQALPPNILSGALASADINPLVIDYYSRHADCAKELLDVVILNQTTADETIARIAQSATQKQIDLIATNEERVLRHPDIIAAMYKNKQARMSTVDRVVELAARNEVKVAGIPAWDEVSRGALMAAQNPQEKLAVEVMDQLFEKAAAEEEDSPTPESELNLRDMTIPMKIRLAMIGTKFQRSMLIRDPKKMVALAAIKSPSVKENEAGKYASNNSICEDVIAYIASRKDWTKVYSIKQSLVANPKCPLPSAMRLLPHLRAKDIANIARSRSVPSALAAQAKKLKMARGGGRR
jgi:hypothetical protein